MICNTITLVSLFTVSSYLHSITKQALSGHTQSHYANMFMHYVEIFKGCKNDNIKMKKNDIFHIFA